MADSFELRFPKDEGAEFVHTLNIGEILFLLGANGSGKSGLITRFTAQHTQDSKRISAHRQTWFLSNTIDITPRARDSLFNNIRSQDSQERSRWRQEYAAERAGVAIYDLIDADTMQERRIASLVRQRNVAGAADAAKIPSPIQVLNELMYLSNIPIEISIESGQKVIAKKNHGGAFSIAELSDGERNAFLIAADILTARPGTLLLIDEPERHLHRAIISPLLTLLFERRPDCAFVISTHELMLPMDNPDAQTLLVRSCSFQGSAPKSWKADLLRADAAIDDDAKRDLLGSRQKILFVEGGTQSLDAPLYSLLFPQVSIIAKGSCRDVEQAVMGLRNVADVHWIQAWGVVDNDRRNEADVDRLRRLGIHALSYYSVESLYFHPEILRRVSVRQAEVTGDNPEHLLQIAINDGVEEARRCRDHLILLMVEKLVRQSIFSSLPTRDDIRSNAHVRVDIDVDRIRNEEEAAFDALINANDLDGLLQHYALRESGALARVAAGLGFPNRAKYESAVRKLLQDDADCLVFLRCLLGDLSNALGDR